MKLRTAVVQWLVQITKALKYDTALSCALPTSKEDDKGLVETGAQGEQEVVSGQSLVLVLLHYQQLKDSYSKSIREAPSEMRRCLIHAHREMRKDVSEESQQNILKGDQCTIAKLLFLVHKKLRRLHPRRIETKKDTKLRGQPNSFRPIQPANPVESHPTSSATSSPYVSPPNIACMASMGLDEQFVLIEKNGMDLEQQTECLGMLLVKCTITAFEVDHAQAVQYLTRDFHNGFTQALNGLEETNKERAYQWCMLLFNCSKRISNGILATYPSLQRLTIHRVLALLSPPLLSPFCCVVSAVGGVFARVCYDLAMAGFYEEMWVWFVGARNTGFQAMASACRRHGGRAVMDLFPLLDIVCRRFFHLLFGVHLQTSMSKAVSPQDLLLLCAHLLPLIAASPASKNAFVLEDGVANILSTVQWLQQKQPRLMGNHGKPETLTRGLNSGVQELLASLVLNFHHNIIELREEAICCLKMGMKSQFVEDQLCACAILYTLLCTQKEMQTFVYRSMVLVYVQEIGANGENEILIDFIRDSFISAHATLPDLPVFVLTRSLGIYRGLRICIEDFKLLLSLFAHPRFDVNDAAYLLHRLFPLAVCDPVLAGSSTLCIVHCIGWFHFKLEVLSAVDAMLEKAVRCKFRNQDKHLLKSLVTTLLSLPYRSFTERVHSIVYATELKLSAGHKEGKSFGNDTEMRNLAKNLSPRLQPILEKRDATARTEVEQQRGTIHELLLKWNSALLKTFLFFAHEEAAESRLRKEMRMSVGQFNRFCLSCRMQPGVLNRRNTLALFNRGRPHYGGAHFLHFQRCIVEIISTLAFDSFTRNEIGSLGKVLQVVSLIYYALLRENANPQSKTHKSRAITALKSFAATDRAFLVDVALDRPPGALPLLSIHSRLHPDVKQLFNVHRHTHGFSAKCLREAEKTCVVVGLWSRREAVEAALQIVDKVLFEAVSISLLVHGETHRNQSTVQRDELSKWKAKRTIEVKRQRHIEELKRQKMLEGKLTRYQKERNRRMMKERTGVFRTGAAHSQEKDEYESRVTQRTETKERPVSAGNLKANTLVSKEQKHLDMLDTVMAIAEDTWRTILVAVFQRVGKYGSSL